MSENIIGLLKEFLKKAESGEISGIAVVAFNGPSNIKAHFRDLDSTEAAAATAFLGHLTAQKFYNVTDDEAS